MNIKLLVAACALTAFSLFASSTPLESGELRMRASGSSLKKTTTRRYQHYSGRRYHWRSDYRGYGRQPGYRSFYRYNAFFPGYNYTSPYGYDYY
jgi:hypothetical protein